MRQGVWYIKRYELDDVAQEITIYLEPKPRPEKCKQFAKYTRTYQEFLRDRAAWGFEDLQDPADLIDKRLRLTFDDKWNVVDVASAGHKSVSLLETMLIEDASAGYDDVMSCYGESYALPRNYDCPVCHGHFYPPEIAEIQQQKNRNGYLTQDEENKLANKERYRCRDMTCLNMRLRKTPEYAEIPLLTSLPTRSVITRVLGDYKNQNRIYTCPLETYWKYCALFQVVLGLAHNVWQVDVQKIVEATYNTDPDYEGLSPRAYEERFFMMCYYSRKKEHQGYSSVLPAYFKKRVSAGKLTWICVPGLEDTPWMMDLKNIIKPSLYTIYVPETWDADR